MVSFPPLKPKWNERDLPLIEDRIGFPTPSREAYRSPRMASTLRR